MPRLRTLLVMSMACALHTGVLSANPTTAPASEGDPPAVRVTGGVSDGADPTSTDAATPASGQVERTSPEIAFARDSGRFILRLSFVDDRDSDRLDLGRFSAGAQSDAWDLVGRAPIGITGWLTGRENAWGRAGDSREEALADMFNDMGCTLPMGITAGLLMSASPSENRAGRRARDAMLATSAATHLLKFVIDSPRPCEADNLDGFPSGHTSTSMAFARAIAQENEEWGVAAYLWAGGVAWSRVRRGDHNREQVIAGALLGWFVADAMMRESETPAVRMPRDGGPMIPAGRASW